MGMFSEIIASDNADSYEKILLAAIDDYEHEIFEGSEAVVHFCREYILPMYNEAFRTETSENEKKIDDFFGNV